LTPLSNHLPRQLHGQSQINTAGAGGIPAETIFQGTRMQNANASKMIQKTKRRKKKKNLMPGLHEDQILKPTERRWKCALIENSIC
jgi:hypothetical protein